MERSKGIWKCNKCHQPVMALTGACTMRMCVKTDKMADECCYTSPSLLYLQHRSTNKRDRVVWITTKISCWLGPPTHILCRYCWDSALNISPPRPVAKLFYVGKRQEGENPPLNILQEKKNESKMQPMRMSSEDHFMADFKGTCTAC